MQRCLTAIALKSPTAPIIKICYHIPCYEQKDFIYMYRFQYRH